METFANVVEGKYVEIDSEADKTFLTVVELSLKATVDVAFAVEVIFVFVCTSRDVDKVLLTMVEVL